MHELCSYGSVGGLGGNAQAYLEGAPIFCIPFARSPAGGDAGNRHLGMVQEWSRPLEAVYQHNKCACSRLRLPRVRAIHRSS